MSAFIDLAVAGLVEDEEIDDYVEMWHESADDLGPIYSFLGMTEEEYAAWALDPDVLPHIITAHKRRKSFSDTLKVAYEERLAARSGNPDKLAHIRNWLQQHS
jgi:hypothetical protein